MKSLSIVIDQVLPPSSVLFKGCHGAWEFFKDEVDFGHGLSYLSQGVSESFSEFISRVIEKLMQDEQGSEDPDVSIDYAIWRDKE